ncbi:hypothetical protein D3C76_970560 [compost metagenome]
MIEPGDGPGPRQSFQHALAEGADPARDKKDHQGDDQPRNRADDGVKHVPEQVQQVMIKAFTPGSGVRKALQNKGQPLVGEQQHHGPVHQCQQAPDQRKQVAGIQ